MILKVVEFYDDALEFAGKCRATMSTTKAGT